MAKRRKKTDFTEQRAFIKHVREMVDRELARIRAEREAERREQAG